MILLWLLLADQIPIIEIPFEPPQVTQRYREVTAIVTAYNENDGHTPGTTMANGEEVHEGAVANDQLDLGTVVEIAGERYIVKDRFGGDHPIERFDVYRSSRNSALRFGRQILQVKILEDE
jgi:3D (Asp-Asp-Asp) domain-containing protein